MPVIFFPSFMHSFSFFAQSFGADFMITPFDLTSHSVIASSAQCIVIRFVDFWQFAVIDSVPANVNFFKSGSNVSL